MNREMNRLKDHVYTSLEQTIGGNNHTTENITDDKQLRDRKSPKKKLTVDSTSNQDSLILLSIQDLVRNVDHFGFHMQKTDLKISFCKITTSS